MLSNSTVLSLSRPFLAGVDMRVTVALLAGWISVFVLVVAAPARVDDASTLKAEFLRDYPVRWKRSRPASCVRGVWSSARMSDIPSATARNGATLIDSKTLEFECKLPSMVRVVETGEVAMTKGDATKSTGHWHVRCYNDDYSFELKKHTADGKFSVTSLLNSTEGKFKDEKRRMADKLLEYLGAPFTWTSSR